MSTVPLISFEDDPPRGSGDVGATTQRIARALDACGIDAPTSLYDEALAFAQEGRLAPAAERLRMLLCLDPSDADAALLLGKILAAREQWQESLTWLDSAVANGAVLPPNLREQTEAGLRQQIADAEDYRTRVASRERGEIRNLRSEAKRLRSENVSLEIEVDELRRRVRLWSGATAVIAGAASALLLAVLLFGDKDATAVEEGALEDVAVAEAPAAAAAPALEVVPVKPPAAALPAAQKGPPVAPAQAAAAVMATHTVKKGDNLGSIARKYYGDSSDWPRIQEANKATLKGGKDLQIGMKLAIPAR